MKKSYIIIMLLTLLSTGLLCVEKKGPLPVKQDTLALRLIPALKHNLQINYVESKGKLLFIDTISVLKADLENNLDRTFFMNKAFVINKITINGTEVSVREYNNLEEHSFSPRLRLLAKEEIKENCRILTLVPKGLDFETLPDTFNIKIKFDLNTRADFPTIVKTPGRLNIIGNAYWYPRNLHKHENLHLTFLSGDVSNIEINNQTVDFTQTGYMRKAEMTFVDPADSPRQFSLISPGLK